MDILPGLASGAVQQAAPRMRAGTVTMPADPAQAMFLLVLFLLLLGCLQVPAATIESLSSCNALVSRLSSACVGSSIVDILPGLSSGAAQLHVRACSSTRDRSRHGGHASRPSTGAALPALTSLKGMLLNDKITWLPPAKQTFQTSGTLYS